MFKMSYANNEQTRTKSLVLFDRFKKHLISVKPDESLFFKRDETVYIPDLHGDFVHLIITLYRHGLLGEELNLKNDFNYVFLGDFYDRAPDADVIDYWLNIQIENKLKINRLAGNHEIAFFERNEDGHPVIFPSQDSIRDIARGFQVTENLLENIANGGLLAAYVESQMILYVHSYVTCEDYLELGLDLNSNVSDFAVSLNKRFQENGKYSYDIFMDCKKKNKYSWKSISGPFNNDPLFNIEKRRNDINTSFLWRRTGAPTLNIYPHELEATIPNNVYQIVGHTPVFSFNLPRGQEINKPFVLKAKSGTGEVQFSDVGIGYYYKSDSFERPEVVISKLP